MTHEPGTGLNAPGKAQKIQSKVGLSILSTIVLLFFFLFLFLIGGSIAIPAVELICSFMEWPNPLRFKPDWLYWACVWISAVWWLVCVAAAYAFIWLEV